MSYVHHRDTELALKVGRPPWLLFLFLAAVFFVNYHDLSNNYHDLSNVRGETDSLNSSVDNITSSVDEGSIVRRITLLSFGIVAIVSLVRDRTNRRLRVDGPLGWLILSFIVLAFMSPIWAEDLPLTLRRVAIFGILCIAAVAVARRFSLRDLILWTFFSTVVFLFVGIVAEVFYGTFRPFTIGYRFAGSLHPNGQGIECGLLMLSALAAADLEKRWRSLFWSFAFLGFVFLILTKSRTAIAAAALALVVYLVAVGSRRLKVAMACSFSMACCLLFLLFVAGLLPSLNSAIQLGRDDAGDADSFDGRSLVWKDVGQYIRQRPILGYGYCAFWTPAHIRVISDEENWAVPDSHSAYIEYLAGLGIVGLAAYTSLLLAGIGRAFRFHGQTRNAAFAFCGALLVFYALDGLFESALFEGSLVMFLCMVVLIRLAFVCRQGTIGVDTL